MQKQITSLFVATSLLWVTQFSCAKSQVIDDTPIETLKAPTTAEGEAFTERTQAELMALWVSASNAAWTMETDITDAHQEKATMAEEKTMAYTAKAIGESTRYDNVELSPRSRRALNLLKTGGSLPGPVDDAKRKELAGLSTELSSIYGKGKHCITPAEGTGEKGEEVCRTLGDFEDVLRTSRNEAELLDAWVSWRTISPPMRPKYERFVELANTGAKDIGYDDVSILWRSRYDMAPEEFEAESERLYAEVKPLYDDLHCYVRKQLRKKYPEAMGDKKEIPAHLLGNMWAQSWSNIYDLVEPYKVKEKGPDITAALVKKGYDAKKMVELGESFFTSLGMQELPDSFWTNSMITKPEGKEVVCHASAWDVSFAGDVRIKMCTKVNEEDLVTIHHELGHIYYFLYYNTLPALFQDGAHDGFHEAIGDAIALSVNPSYYKSRGVLDEVVENNEALVNQQMRDALDKVAFLPFGMLVDKYRWDVFSGKTAPADYNAAWWSTRTKYQGIVPPVTRTEADFDPGAKFHIPANVPYARYFLARILQFQIHKSLCDVSGFKGPLHQCSIYGSKEAGDRLKAFLALGSTVPWPDALEKLTGERTMNAKAMVDYFAPLQTWLKEENKGESCGW